MARKKTTARKPKGNTKAADEFAKAFNEQVAAESWEATQKARQEYQDDSPYELGNSFVRVLKVKLGVGGSGSNNPGIPYMRITLMGLDGPNKGRNVSFHHTITTEENANGVPKITQLLQRSDDLGYPLPDEMPTSETLQNFATRLNKERPSYEINVTAGTPPFQNVRILRKLDAAQLEEVLSGAASAPKKATRRRRS